MSLQQTPIVRDVTTEQAPYRGLAFTQMGILKAYMKTAGLNVYSRVVTLANGVVITCKVCFNREDIHIYVPPVVPVLTKEIVSVTTVNGEFHVLADDKHWILKRSPQGAWKKELLYNQLAGDDPILQPWGFSHDWYSADRLVKLTDTNVGHFRGRYFSRIQEPSSNVSYAIPVPSYTHYTTANPQGTTINSIYSDLLIQAVTAIGSGEKIAVSVYGLSLSVRRYPDTAEEKIIDISEKIKACFAAPAIPRELEPPKWAADGLLMVCQYDKSTPSYNVGHIPPVPAEPRNLKFTFDFSQITIPSPVEGEPPPDILALIDASVVTVEDLGASLSTVQNITPISTQTGSLGSDGKGFREIYVQNDYTEFRTFYDIKEQTLVRIDIGKTTTTDMSQIDNLAAPPRLSNTLHQEGANTLTDTKSSVITRQSFIQIDGIDLYRSAAHITTEESSFVNTYTIPDRGDALSGSEVPMPYDLVAVSTRSSKNNIVEVRDFDARRGIITLTEFVEAESVNVNASRLGSVGQYSWSIPASFGIVTSFVSMADSLSSNEYAAGTTQTTTTTAIEKIIVDGVEVFSSPLVGTGTTKTNLGYATAMNINNPTLQSSEYGGTRLNLDRAGMAVRSAVTSFGDVLVLSFVHEGLRELSSFFPAWSINKEIFVQLKDHTGAIIDFSQFGFAEIQRIGLCEGYGEELTTTTTPQEQTDTTVKYLAEL